jgi:hypothetical protein
MLHKPMDDLDFISLVAELNDMAYEATNSESVSFMPFRFINSGNSQVIEFFGQVVWDSENNEWGEDDKETMREHIVENVYSVLISLVKLGDMRKSLEALRRPLNHAGVELTIGQRFRDPSASVWEITAIVGDTVFLCDVCSPGSDHIEFVRSEFEKMIVNGQSVRVDDSVLDGEFGSA